LFDFGRCWLRSKGSWLYMHLVEFPLCFHFPNLVLKAYSLSIAT
jgi:hypothetical protein